MKIAIHQPNYIPYPGFFAKAKLCDVFVFYDTAQFTRGDYINRNRIRTFAPSGSMWLTLPVGKKKFEGVPISEVTITDNDIFDKHCKTVKNTYSRAPYFDEEICERLETKHDSLAEHNTSLARFLFEKLELNPRIVNSSELRIPKRHGTSGIMDIVKALQGTHYISGLGARNYLEKERFKEESIDLSFAAYEPWEYPQIHPGFASDMSIIDAVFNLGWTATSQKLKETGLEDHKQTRD